MKIFCGSAPGMQVVQSKPVMHYSQTNGTMIKTGGSKKIIVEQDSGEDEEIEETQTIIKKTIIRKKGKKTYVRFEKFMAKCFRGMVEKSLSLPRSTPS